MPSAMPQGAWMSLTLAEAAAQVGVNRSTILRAVKSGKISGTRDDDGAWHVEPAELFRVFEPAQPEAEAEPQHALTNALVAELRARLEDMRLTIEDVRRD